jgi:hypothetical protein
MTYCWICFLLDGFRCPCSILFLFLFSINTVVLVTWRRVILFGMTGCLYVIFLVSVVAAYTGHRKTLVSRLDTGGFHNDLSLKSLKSSAVLSFLTYICFCYSLLNSKIFAVLPFLLNC